MVGLYLFGFFVVILYFHGCVCCYGVTKFSLNSDDWTLTNHLSNITG